MNKNCYRNLNTYTEDKNTFILPEDIKDARRIKAQKLRNQKTIVLEWLTVVIIIIKSLSRRENTSRVIQTLVLI